MGHEGGHDIFHRGYFSYNPNQRSLFDDASEQLIQCREVNTKGKTKPLAQWNDKDTMEWQANYFSSALLMPKSMVLKSIQSLPPRQDIFRNATYVHEVVRTLKLAIFIKNITELKHRQINISAL